MNGPYDWSKIESKTISEGFRARFIHAGSMTFALWEIDPGTPLPEHAHPHEQVTHVLEGEFDLIVNGVVQHLRPGSVTVIPPHVSHSGKAFTHCLILDVFSPVREDYRF